MEDLDDPAPGSGGMSECIGLCQTKVCGLLGITGDVWDRFSRSENWWVIGQRIDPWDAVGGHIKRVSMSIIFTMACFTPQVGPAGVPVSTQHSIRHPDTGRQGFERGMV